MTAHNITQMSRHHSTGIDHGIAQRLRMVLVIRIDPDGIHTEGWILGGRPLQLTKNLPRIDRQVVIRLQLPLTHRHPHQTNTIAIGRDIQIVSNMDWLHQKAKLFGELAPHPLDAINHLPILIDIHHWNQAVSHL